MEEEAAEVKDVMRERESMRDDRENREISQSRRKSVALREREAEIVSVWEVRAFFFFR